MKKKLLTLTLLLATFLPTPGCGTILATKESGPTVYGGICLDYAAFVFSSSEVIRYGAVLDIPFSLTLDTMMLPLTVPLTFWALPGTFR